MQSYYDGSGLAEHLGGAIVIGVDATGAHIFGVEHGHSTFMDSIGFVAAGGGQWHAESQFMFARYTKWWTFPDALSLVYAAKKRAEVAPGVGGETDLVIVTTRPPNVILVNDASELVRGLDGIYKETTKKQDEVFKGQHARVKAFIDELLKTAATASQQVAPVASSGEIGPAPLQPSAVVEAEVVQQTTPKPSRKRMKQ